MKKIYFLFLMALLPLLASAETLEINGINYNVNPEAKTATVISKSSGSYSGKIVIPQTVSFKNIKCKVISIGDYAFEYCSGLTSVTIPSTVTSIGTEAFYYCTNLTSIKIPNSVTSIGNYAFYYCSSLTSINILSSVTSIGSDAFYGTPWYNNKPDGVVYAGKMLYKYKGTMPSGTKISIKNGTLGIANYAFSDCSGLTSVTIPNSVISIGSYAFRNCSNLKTATIGNSVTSIGSYAFYGCSSLKTANIPNDVTKIEECSFYGCSGLTSVTIPNSVTSIGSSAFYGCSGLKSANIGNSVTSIGYSAFYGCSGLKSANIPNSVTSIGSYAFYGCSGLTSVIIPNSVSSIGSYAFYNCSGLKSATIGNSVARIEDYTFYGCNSLATVMLGNGINYLGYYSFAYCGQLTDFYCFAENVPSCYYSYYYGYYTFYNSYINYANLHVPAVSVSSYRSRSPWSGFKDIVAIETVKVKLNKTKVTLEKGETVKLKSTFTPSTFPDRSVTWKSSNKKVATVTSSGKVTAVNTGTASITCTSNVTGAKATCKVTVGYGSVTLNTTQAYIEKGKTITLKATVEPTTLEDKRVTWTSSDEDIATVSSSGKVKGVKYGTATITCTSKATGASATCKVTVGKVVVSITDVTIKKSRGVTLEATVYPTSLTDKSVKWTSSDKTIATVSAGGKVKGIAAGTATITCTSVVTGLSATCKVTVLATSESRSTDGSNDNVTGIENLEEAPVATEPYDVYDLSGRKVLNQTTSLDGLPDGIYIVNGRKILKK